MLIAANSQGTIKVSCTAKQAKWLHTGRYLLLRALLLKAGRSVVTFAQFLHIASISQNFKLIRSMNCALQMSPPPPISEGT